MKHACNKNSLLTDELFKYEFLQLKEDNEILKKNVFLKEIEDLRDFVMGSNFINIKKNSIGKEGSSGVQYSIKTSEKQKQMLAEMKFEI
jgi:hypothetical protein